MRTLLEIHYDSVHFERWKKRDGKAPLRRSEYHVFTSTINAHRKKLCQRLALPKDVRSILQVPRHEDDPTKLEELRGVILREIEGEEFLLVDTKAQAEGIARAIEGCPRGAFVDEVGAGCCLPEGCRVLLDEECQNKESVANIVRAVHNDWLRVRMRPYGTCRAPLVDEFATKLRDKTVEELEVELTKQEILDRMLLCLFDALFLKQSERWSNAGVANLNVDETPELARWFLRGRNVGSKPIFDGICAMCGTLLHGVIDH